MEKKGRFNITISKRKVDKTQPSESQLYPKNRTINEQTARIGRFNITTSKIKVDEAQSSGSQLQHIEEKVSDKQVTDELKERFNISMGGLIGSGDQGSVYEIQNNNDYVVKIVKSEKGAVSNNIKDRISVMGGGITKPLDSYKLDNGTVVEIYKKREGDCKNLLESNGKNLPVMSTITQLFLITEVTCDNGVILGDLKPDNMLISKNGGKVTISDLGSTMTVEDGEKGQPRDENREFLAFGDPKKTVKSPVYSVGAVTLCNFMDENFLNFLEKCIVKYKNTYKSKHNGYEDQKIGFTLVNGIMAALDNSADIKEYNTVISDNITPDIINLKKAFPDVDFEKKEKEKGKEKIEEEVKKKFCELFKGMLMIDPEQRDSITESKKKLINTIEYLVDEVGLDIKNDLKLNDKILFNLGMFDRMKDKDEYVEDEKKEILNNIEMFLGKEVKGKKEKEHMATIFGIEKFDEKGEIVPKKVNLSRGAEECLKNLRAFVSNDKKNDIKLEENIKYLKEINEKEYLLLNKLFNDSKIIKGLLNEKSKSKSGISI